MQATNLQHLPYLKVELPGQRPGWLPLDKIKMTLGKDETCDLQIPHETVSGLHAVLEKVEQDWQLGDKDSRNGLLVEGLRQNQIILKPGLQVHAGQAVLQLVPAEKPQVAVDVEQQKPAELPEVTAELITTCRTRFFDRIDQYRDHNRLEDSELKQLLASILNDCCSGKYEEFLRPDLFGRLEKKLTEEILGLGPLEDLLRDDDITEIMVNGCQPIYVEKAGKISVSNSLFTDERLLLHVIDRIIAPLGRRIDESSPAVDARLPDGSRVHAIIPPLSVRGPCITIRKFKALPLNLQTLIDNRTLPQAAAKFLEECVQQRRNIVISGGTGSGKTTLLNILSSCAGEQERIVTIEDAVELALPQEHVVPLEARPKNIEGQGEITIRDLLRNALRMRPDRIIVGECRGAEALDMLQAMNTGHDGGLATLHANTPRDALARLETMILMAGYDLPLKAVREQIARAVDLVVQIQRQSGGRRRVSCISEVCGMEESIIVTQDIFAIGPDGELRASGLLPSFLEKEKRSSFIQYL